MLDLKISDGVNFNICFKSSNKQVIHMINGRHLFKVGIGPHKILNAGKKLTLQISQFTNALISACSWVVAVILCVPTWQVWFV